MARTSPSYVRLAVYFTVALAAIIGSLIGVVVWRHHSATAALLGLGTRNLPGSSPFAGVTVAKIRSDLDAGADVNAKYYRGDTVLWAAAISGDIDCVKLLVSKGADVNAVDSDGYSVLMAAALSGNASCVKFLVDSGADLSAKDNSGETVLMGAAHSANFDCFKYLVAKGQDVNAKCLRQNNIDI